MMGAKAFYEQSLCMECDKACTKECSWAREFIPVPGWTADYRPVNVSVPRKDDSHDAPDGRYSESYMVRACPEFEPYRRMSSRGTAELNSGGLMALMEKCLELAGRDYIDGKKKERADIKEFFETIAPYRSKAIMPKLMQEAAEHDRIMREKRYEKDRAADLAFMHRHWIHLFVLEAYRDFGY